MHEFSSPILFIIENNIRMLINLKPETIIDLINKGELQLARNRQGQYFLRQTHSVAEEKILFKKHLASESQIHQSLLHEDVAIPRMNIQHWLKKIQPTIQTFNLAAIENFAVASNQLSLILMHVNQVAKAEKLCCDAIIFYQKLSEIPGKEDHILYTLQPFINLVRIQKITRKYRKFQQLLPALNAKPFKVNYPDFSHISTIIEKAATLAQEYPVYKNLLELNFLVEHIKYCIVTEDYIAITAYYEKSFSAGKVDYYNNYAAEAACLAYQVLGKFEEAYQLAAYYFDKGMIEHMEIFSYRKAEIFRNTGEKSLYRKECEKLSSYCLRIIKAGLKNLNQLAFCQAMATLVDDKNISVFINQQCYQSAIELEDEMRCLQILEKLLLQAPTTKWQNEYQYLRQKTDYLRFKAAGSALNPETHALLEQVLYQCNEVLHAA